MGFHSCAAEARPGGEWELSDPRPLALAGRDGLIARFVLGAPERAVQPWSLGVEELHVLAGLAAAADRMIVFRPRASRDDEVLALEMIRGTSAERTEMMFSFSPLQFVARSPILHVRAPAGRRTYLEELALDGGVHAPEGSWNWRRAHLALGGVVCSPGR